MAEVDRIEQDREINNYTFVDESGTVLDEVKLFFNYHATLGSDSSQFCQLVADSRDSNPILLNRSDYKTALEAYIKKNNITPQNPQKLEVLCWDIVQDAIQFIGSKDVSSIMTDADLHETVSLNGQEKTKVKPGFYADFKKLPRTLPRDGETTYKIQVKYSKHR